MQNMATALENQKALTKRFVEVEEAWDAEGNVALRTEDCKYQLLPLSMGHAVRNNAEFKDFYNSFKPLWSNYKVIYGPFILTPCMLKIARSKSARPSTTPNSTQPSFESITVQTHLLGRSISRRCSCWISQRTGRS
jgi:hypothetical protein